MSKTVEITNTRKRVYTANGVTLVPGKNRVEELAAKKFLAHPHIQIKIDRGIIVLGKEVELPKNAATAVEPKPDEASEEVTTGEFPDLEYSIDGLNAEPAIDAIKTIEDKEYLLHITITDERKTVIKAAQDRLAELEAEVA